MAVQRVVFAHHSGQIGTVCSYAAEGNKFLDDHLVAIGFGDRFHDTGSSRDVNVPHAVDVKNPLADLVQHKSQMDNRGRAGALLADNIRTRLKCVIWPDGSPLSVQDLPPAATRRWVIRRKAEVVAAVRGGLLSLEEACERYTLSVDEVLTWQMQIDRHGLAGLRTTKIQKHRN